MKKRSKILITSLVLCAVVAIGATFAYFFTSTETKTNTFTMSSGIKIELAEPTFDNKNYNGTSANILDSQLGNVLSQNFVPGRVIPKDPSVKNASTTDSVWIAIKLDYIVNDLSATYADLANFAYVNFDTDATAGEWKANDDNTIFYYKTAVPAGINTSELFTTVTINNDADAYHPFDIKVTAYAVQAEGITLAGAETQLAGYIAK